MTFLDGPARRPATITVLAVLIVIAGLLAVLGGVLIIILRDDPRVLAESGLSSGIILWLGILALVIGLVYLGVARGLTRGSALARGLVTFVTVVGLISNVYQAIVHTGNLRWNAITSIAFGLLILLLLFSARANAFFRSRSAAAG